MALKTSSPEDLAKGQEYLRTLVKPPVTEVRNVATATELNADTYFQFKGAWYKAPPLDYRLGIQLQEILLEIHRLGQQADDKAEHLQTDAGMIAHLQQLKLCYERAAKLFHDCCTPIVFWRRWRWKRYNPFSSCSSQEVAELLNFFSLCRMKSRVRLMENSVARPSLSMLMQPTSLLASSPNSVVG